MNKKLMSIAVASALALPMVNANAGDMAKVYGEVHVALERVKLGDADPTYDVNGKTRKANKLGLKGAVDTNLLDFKAVYQFEIGLDHQQTFRDTYFQRDTWAGLTSKSMGTVRAGTIETAWKSNAKLVDPLFTTALEARDSVIHGESSNLAGGVAPDRGRATHSVRYDSPSFSGVKVSANYAFNQTGVDPMGLGVTWKAKGMAAFFNYQSTTKDAGTLLSAMKVGGKAMFGAFGVSGAYAIDSGAIGGSKDDKQNMLYLAGTYGMGATTFVLSFSMADAKTSTSKDNSTGFGLAVNQKLAKKVSIYAGYGQSSGGSGYTKVDALALGMIAKF